MWAEKQGRIEHIHGDYTCTEDTESDWGGVCLEVAPEEPHDIPEDTESSGSGVSSVCSEAALQDHPAQGQAQKADPGGDIDSSVCQEPDDLCITDCELAVQMTETEYYENFVVVTVEEAASIEKTT